MKRIFLAVVLVLVTASASCAGVSEDIYVRQDVFDAKMEAFLNRMLVELENVRGDIKDVKGDIKALSSRIDSVESKLSFRIDSVEGKVDVLQTVVYWGLGILSLLITSFVLAPVVGAVVQKMKAPSIGIEDVKRLIEENNAKLLSSLRNYNAQ